MSRMPTTYPGNLPLRWQDEASGELPLAIYAFLDQCAVRRMNRRALITPEQVELLREYFAYCINAPCFFIQQGVDKEAYFKAFGDLRERVKSLRSAEEINDWLHDCLRVGIDLL